VAPTQERDRGPDLEPGALDVEEDLAVSQTVKEGALAPSLRKPSKQLLGGWRGLFLTQEATEKPEEIGSAKLPALEFLLVRQFDGQLRMMNEEMEESAHGVGGRRTRGAGGPSSVRRRWDGVQPKTSVEILPEEIANDRLAHAREQSTGRGGVTGTGFDRVERSVGTFEMNEKVSAHGPRGLDPSGEGLRPFSREKSVGILALGQFEVRRSPFGFVEREKPFEAAARRAAARLVSVEAEDDVRFEAKELLGLSLGERRAETGHDRFEPALGECEDVHVAFDDEKRLPPTPGEAGFVLPVEESAFVKERSFGRIQILGLLVGVKSASPKAHGPSARVPDREKEAVAEDFNPLAAAATEEAGFFEEGQALASALAERVEGTLGGGVAESETGDGLGTDAAPSEVRLRRRTVGERTTIKRRGFLKKIIEETVLRGGAAFSSRRRGRPGDFGQATNSFRELEPLERHQEAERGSVCPATEAMVKPFLRTDCKGGRPFVVERTAPEILVPAAAEFDAGPDQGDEVAAGEEIVDVVLGNRRGHGVPPPRKRSAAEAGLDTHADLAHVGAPGQLSAQDVHDFTHPRDAARAEGGDRLFDEAVDFRFFERGGEIAPDERGLRLLATGEVLASCPTELRDGFFVLFEELVENRDHLGVLERAPLVDFALLDGSGNVTESADFVFPAGFESGHGVGGEALLERHQKISSCGSCGRFPAPASSSAA
jgi:hypothetical protein